MMKKLIATFLLIMLTSCAPAFVPTPAPVSAISTFAAPIELPSPTPTSTFMPTPLPTSTFTSTAIPFVESLKATVTADLLTCRYGPGAEYLYLFAFKKGANIKLIGRTDGRSNWVMVFNEPQKCWINKNFVEIQGDTQTLQPMYPDGYKLIVSPYYGPTAVLSAERKGDEVTVTWVDVPISPGKYETPDMFPYIVEVWRCENGEIIFDSLGSRFPYITFIDQAGCSVPSHGRVFVQEKHGYAGPAEIPWPVR